MTAAPKRSSSSSSSPSLSPFVVEDVVESVQAPVTTATPSMSTPAGPRWSNRGEKADESGAGDGRRRGEFDDGGGDDCDCESSASASATSSLRAPASTWKLVGTRANERARGKNLGSLMPPLRSRSVALPPSRAATAGAHSLRASGGRSARPAGSMDDDVGGDEDDDGNGVGEGEFREARAAVFVTLVGLRAPRQLLGALGVGGARESSKSIPPKKTQWVDC